MNASLYINFGTAIITFVFGLLILTGVLYPSSNNSSKIMFGIVLMIYGIYRFVTSVSKVKQAKLKERRDKLNEEKEKLLGKL